MRGRPESDAGRDAVLEQVLSTLAANPAAWRTAARVADATGVPTNVVEGCMSSSPLFESAPVTPGGERIYRLRRHDGGTPSS